MAIAFRAPPKGCNPSHGSAANIVSRLQRSCVKVSMSGKGQLLMTCKHVETFLKTIKAELSGGDQWENTAQA